MTQIGTRADWIQHDPEHVQRAVEFLPHLWRQMEAPSPAPAPTSATDPAAASHAAAPPMPAEASPQERLVEAEERFTAELAAVRADAAHWQAHAQAVEAEARAQGFAAGHAAGEQQGRSDGEAAVRAEAQQALARLATLADTGVIDLRAALNDAHATLATLSIAIARAIIGEAFARDPELLARRIVRLLERLSDVTTATVRLHPTDLAIVQAHWPGLAQTYGWVEQGPRLLGDDAITPGGCIVEARTHYLDARIETLSALVQEAFATVYPLPTVEDSHDALITTLPTPATEEAA